MPVDSLLPASVSPSPGTAPSGPTALTGAGGAPTITASGMVVLELAARSLPVDGVSVVNVCCTVA
jgi:hypothetical protein